MPDPLDYILGGAGAAAGLALAEKGYSDLGKIGERAFSGFAGDGGLADVISGRLDFQPYTVTTATGSNFGMSQAPSTGSIGRVDPNLTNQGLFDAYNAAATETAGTAQDWGSTAAAGSYTQDIWTNPDYFIVKKADGTLSRATSEAEAQAMSGASQAATTNMGFGDIYSSVIPASVLGTAAEAGTTAGEQYAPGQMDYLLTLSPDEKAFYEDRLAGATGMFEAAQADPAAREATILERIRTASAPQQERARLELEERLANQGRLGVRTSMFGGTSEQLAMAKAQEEADSQAILAAMEYAANEQERQARLGSGMLAAGYVPQAQLLGAVTPGMTASERRRQSVSEATQAYGETYASGLQALLSSALGQAGIAGNFGTSMAKAALGGLFS